jgi:hypothetical protein
MVFVCLFASMMWIQSSSGGARGHAFPVVMISRKSCSSIPYAAENVTEIHSSVLASPLQGMAMAWGRVVRAKRTEFPEQRNASERNRQRVPKILCGDN